MNHVEFLNDPEQWPNFPLCSVKRHREGGGMPDCGTVLALPTTVPVVYSASMFSFVKMSKDEIRSVPQHKYESVDDLVADGWMVD